MTLRAYLSAYTSRLPESLVYMLQSNEYDLEEYLQWFGRATDLRHVARRGQLVRTAKARLLLLIARLIMAFSLIGLAVLLWQGYSASEFAYYFWAAAILILLPLLVTYGLALPLLMGEIFIQQPRTRAMVARAAASIARHPGFRIAIAGSYGKTSFKEMLATVLAEGKIVAATPGNMNTPIGISRFAARLKGDEEVVIFELGEYYPRDIARLAELVKPQLGVITGINEAHLSKFKTLERTDATIFELAQYLPAGPVYKNGDNPRVAAKAQPGDPLLYTAQGVNGWTVEGIKISADSTSFTAHKGKIVVHAVTGLLGRQQVGPLCAAIDIAAGLGLTPVQITAGIAATMPYEHRMQPRPLGGAWVIDDTYNGNSDGVKAGIAWLAEVEANRRIYVTPGLVEQGSRTADVHRAIGRELAPVADVVVLMENSVTGYIREGLKAAGFTGELQLVSDPARFYSNLEHFVAAGDIVLMQNDWTDNYA